MFLIPNANEIKRRRIAQKLSSNKLSLKAGLPENAVYRLESGICKRSNHLRMQALATALDCSVEDICTATQK